MAKRGSGFEAIVGSISQALEPTAQVVVGTWVDGPDGRRDMDVSIRGIKDGQDHCALVECKDWKDPVGIGVVDALDSKRRDLGADVAVIYSNSGFTEDASRKAARLGISLCLALKAGDPRIRVLLHRDFYARARSVDHWSLIPIYNRKYPDPDLTEPHSLLYEGMPVVNWFREKTRQILTDHPHRSHLQAEYVFRDELEFQVGDRPVWLKALVLRLQCSHGWVMQTIREDVSLGTYDFLEHRVIIPDKQVWSLGPFDRDAWVPVESPPVETELGPNTIQVNMTVFRPIASVPGTATPDLDQFILEQAVSYPTNVASQLES
jgi:hypothetical protein